MMAWKEETRCEPTIQFDPAFSYYQGRSAQSVAAELELAGYRTVRYFVTKETTVDGRLLDAFHRRGMKVWATVLGNGAYTTEHLPKGWESWQMTLLKPVNDGFYRFSHFSRSYVEWKKTVLHRMVREYAFDGLEIAEPYFPEWNGFSSGVYGDIGPWAVAAFRAYSGSEPPDFVNRLSPRYYKKDPALYQQWIAFRVRAVNHFLDELINAPGGVRSGRPRIRIATWSLAVDAGRDPVAAVKEMQGVDAAEMISVVRPDMHVLQTHWPDWMRSRLPSDYVKRYRPFVEQIRRLHKEIPIGVQTDIGSLKPMRRSNDWLRRFAEASCEEGYRFWTAYEYHIGLSMYEDPPLPLRASRRSRCRVTIECSKRIAVDTNKVKISIITEEEETTEGMAEVEKVDGNRLELLCESFPASRFKLQVQGVRDTPEHWLLKGYPAHEIPGFVTVIIPSV